LVRSVYDYINTARNTPTNTLIANLNNLLGPNNGAEGLARYLGLNTEGDIVRLFGSNERAATNLALASINNTMDQDLTNPRAATMRILYYAYFNPSNPNTNQTLHDTIIFLTQNQQNDLEHVVGQSPSNLPSNPPSNPQSNPPGNPPSNPPSTPPSVS